MKITLNINDSLFVAAKTLAARQRISLTRLVEEGLQLRIRGARIVGKGKKPEIPVFKGRSGLVAGVDPSSNKSMLDAADA